LIERFEAPFDELEQEIATFFADQLSKYNQRSPQISRMMVYFYLHRSLTQKELQHILQLSPGMVSSLLKQLLISGMIRKEIIPHTHTHRYVMDNMPYTNIKFLTEIMGKFEKSHQEIIKICAELDKIPVQRRSDNNYIHLSKLALGLKTMMEPAFKLQEIIRTEILAEKQRSSERKS